MQLHQLQAMSTDRCRQDYWSGKISRFDLGFHDLLTGECQWPEYEAADIVRIRKKYNLSQEGLGRILTVSSTSVSHWERSVSKIPASICLLLRILDALEDVFFDVIKSNPQRIGLIRAVLREEDSLCALPSVKARLTPPAVFGKEELNTLRNRLNLSRKAFAESIGISVSTLDKWESGSVRPSGPTLHLLKWLWLNGPFPPQAN